MGGCEGDCQLCRAAIEAVKQCVRRLVYLARESWECLLRVNHREDNVECPAGRAVGLVKRSEIVFRHTDAGKGASVRACTSIMSKAIGETASERGT